MTRDIWEVRALVAFALLSTLPQPAQAEQPADGVFTPAVRWSLHSTVGTVAWAGQEVRTPVAGLRATLDAETFGNVHVLLRADLSRLSDGGAIDANATTVPSFDSGEFYVAVYWLRGSIGLEVIVGQAIALSSRAQLIEASPLILGGGLRVVVGQATAFVGVGEHGATGRGTRLLVSLLLPIRGNTSLVVDGAAADRTRNVVRSGVAVKF